KDTRPPSSRPKVSVPDNRAEISARHRAVESRSLAGKAWSIGGSKVAAHTLSTISQCNGSARRIFAGFYFAAVVNFPQYGQCIATVQSTTAETGCRYTAS
ncbi:MAG: hypothetical protein WAK32_03045, partial [Xanthobacteraceae bacterium]